MKLFVKKKNARMTTVSVVSACTKDSMIGSKKINGSCDSLKFLDFLKSLDIPQHSVILMDNVKFHHSIIIKEYCKLHLIDILYVPAYSPWFAARKRALRERNPIELCFSIIKRNYYRNQSIDESLNSIKQSHLEAFFNKSLTCIGPY